MQDNGKAPLQADLDSSQMPRTKRLGGYLVDAGLLTPAQVDVVLNDQKFSGMRFGEILAARGWVKQQTIEYLMQKVILPEKQAFQPQLDTQGAVNNAEVSQDKCLDESEHDALGKPLADLQRNRRELPIAKPLPSVSSSDDGVSWVG